MIHTLVHSPEEIKFQNLYQGSHKVSPYPGKVEGIRSTNNIETSSPLTRSSPRDKFQILGDGTMGVNVDIHVAKVTFDQWYESGEFTIL